MLCILDNKNEYSNLCRLISLGDKEIIFSHIKNKLLKDFVSECMKDDPEDRPSIQDLLEHKFITEDLQEKDSFKLQTDWISKRIYEIDKQRYPKPFSKQMSQKLKEKKSFAEDNIQPFKSSQFKNRRKDTLSEGTELEG